MKIPTMMNGALCLRWSFGASASVSTSAFGRCAQKVTVCRRHGYRSALLPSGSSPYSSSFHSASSVVVAVPGRFFSRPASGRLLFANQHQPPPAPLNLSAAARGRHATPMSSRAFAAQLDGGQHRVRSPTMSPAAVSTSSSSSATTCVSGSSSSCCSSLSSSSSSSSSCSSAATSGRPRSASTSTVSEVTFFQPRRVLVLTKLTRLQFERRRCQNLTEEQFRKSLRERGSDYDRLKERHDVHHHYLGLICAELAKRNIDYKVCQRWDYTPEAIGWADAVVAAGGDGTFLLAASRIRNQSKPLIGINTDPSSSEGYLCLTKKLSERFLADAFDKLFSGDFKWLWRQRIRVTLTGRNAYDAPMELHDQQLMYPEYRWSEHVREQEDARFRSHIVKGGVTTDVGTLDISNREEVFLSSELDGLIEPSNVLPFLALNDVYIGESLSSRVSYYELQINNGPMVKQKSSGVTLCTGTGSTSWYFNINKMTEQCLRDLLHIVSDEFRVDIPISDDERIGSVCKRFNDQLIFSPRDTRIAYTVRDPVFNATFPPFPARGFAKSITIKSRCYDAHLVIDGGMSYIFNDGAKADFQIHPQDALRTVAFR